MPERSPDVVLVNPNTNRATTAMITSPEELEASAGYVVALAQDLVCSPEDAPMVVVAAFGDPGVPELRDAGYRVTGIGEATVRRWVPRQWEDAASPSSRRHRISSERSPVW